MGRAESFASKNGVLDSIFDALGIGLGFTGALVLLGSVRELLGNGTIFGFTVWGDALNLYLFILPPGAFITLGLLLGMFNSIGISRENKKKKAGAKK
jgi:electron transport complex protein RnfE